MAKAAYCSLKNDNPPRVHNIVRICELAGIVISQDTKKLMARINELNIEGRYPATSHFTISESEASEYVKWANEVMEWLRNQL